MKELEKEIGGRKFDLNIDLNDQRPGKLDADVLSQCMTQFMLRIVNPVDQAKVAESIESVDRDLFQELPALSKGQAIVAGVAVNTPVLCRVRRASRSTTPRTRIKGIRQTPRPAGRLRPRHRTRSRLGYRVVVVRAEHPGTGLSELAARMAR